MTETLSVQNLSYRYPDKTVALKDLSFEIPLGKRTAILGANGSGKSTLMRHLNALILPQKGSISIGGTTITKKNADEMRKKVGMLFDNPDNQLFSPTVEDDIAFGPANLKLPTAEISRRVDAACETVGIQGLRKRSPYNLSLGQKKKCAIAGILAMEPEILLMDEPFSGLDPISLQDYLSTLDRLYRNGMTQILSTHDVDIAYEWADCVLILSEGSLLAKGTKHIMQDAALMQSARLARPTLVRLFEGAGSIPESFEEARTMLSVLGNN